MPILYKAFVPHIANYLPSLDYDYIAKKSFDYGYISIIERVGMLPNIEKQSPMKNTIQNWGYILSNIGFEFIKITSKSIDNTTYRRAIIIDRDYTVLLILFEPTIS